MGDRYFVRSTEDGPEKGPYTVELIKSSYERAMLKDTAMCRLENGASWISIREVLELPTPGAPHKTAFSSTSNAQREMDAQYARAQSGSNSNMTIGLIMIVAGIVLTIASFSAGSGGGGAVFVGLILFGFIRIVRGAASS